MLDNTGTRATAFEIAAPTVAQRLRQLGVGFRPLTPAELGRYPARGMAAGWRLNVEITGTVCPLDLLLPTGFPWEPPRVALADPPPFLTWPHVEQDALLCLAPNTMDVNSDDPGGVCVAMLGEACALVEWLLKGDFDDDFRNEILSYWGFAANYSGPKLISLISPAPPSRTLRLWRGKAHYLLGEDDDQLSTWLTNFSGKKLDQFRTEGAALIWAGAPPIPSDYPETGRDLQVVAQRAGPAAQDLLRTLALDTPDKLVTVLGAETVNGPALTATILAVPAAPKHGTRDPLTKGFRAGAIPEAILMSRYFGGGKLSRASIERADAAWIHGRGQDKRQPRLHGATVIIIGCGSVGGPMAVALAQAGVGRLVLVDFEDLSWANIGRHPLGAASVARNKARQLAEKLRADFPHMTVEFFNCDADAFVRKEAALLGASDLVISATGSWAADARLDAWQCETGRTTPILYTWTEPHACAGHAVLIGDGGCLRCGVGDTGVPAFAVTAWPAGKTQRSEPACGAVYQPYGPVELGFVTSLAAELALDVLAGKQTASIHRVWVGSHDRLVDAGGAWSASWQHDPKFREGGNCIANRAWPSACTRCASKMAA